MFPANYIIITTFQYYLASFYLLSTVIRSRLSIVRKVKELSLQLPGLLHVAVKMSCNPIQYFFYNDCYYYCRSK